MTTIRGGKQQESSAGTHEDCCFFGTSSKFEPASNILQSLANRLRQERGMINPLNVTLPMTSLEVGPFLLIDIFETFPEIFDRVIEVVED